MESGSSSPLYNSWVGLPRSLSCTPRADAEQTLPLRRSGGARAQGTSLRRCASPWEDGTQLQGRGNEAHFAQQHCSRAAIQDSPSPSEKELYPASPRDRAAKLGAAPSIPHSSPSPVFIPYTDHLKPIRFPAAQYSLFPWQRELRAWCQGEGTIQWFSRWHRVPQLPPSLCRGKYQKVNISWIPPPRSFSFSTQCKSPAGERAALPKLSSAKGFLSASSRGWSPNGNISGWDKISLPFNIKFCLDVDLTSMVLQLATQSKVTSLLSFPKLASQLHCEIIYQLNEPTVLLQEKKIPQQKPTPQTGNNLLVMSRALWK